MTTESEPGTRYELVFTATGVVGQGTATSTEEDPS